MSLFTECYNEPIPSSVRHPVQQWLDGEDNKQCVKSEARVSGFSALKRATMMNHSVGGRFLCIQTQRPILEEISDKWLCWFDEKKKVYINRHKLIVKTSKRKFNSGKNKIKCHIFSKLLHVTTWRQKKGGHVKTVGLFSIYESGMNLFCLFFFFLFFFFFGLWMWH